jgi:hypothetical protein
MTEPETKRIYVASSWRNGMQPAVVATLRAAGLEVYDFRNPEPGDNGFAWSQLDPDWLDWTPEAYVKHLDDPVAVDGYGKDFAAMEWADTFVLVLPCGRSAHLELGWAAGAGKRTAILLSEDGFEPELMYRMVDHLATSVFDLLGWLGVDDA